MNAFVLYGSKFGNTEKVARAIGDALEPGMAVYIQHIEMGIALPPDLDLLIVGSPTHAHGIPAELKTYLDDLPSGALQGVAAAAFDTRYRMPVLISGSAASGIAKRLRQKGARLVRKPESFFVEHGEGPLAEGEIERAAAWAHALGEVMSEAA
ncbi:MAG: flavodoxin family protein [Thermomicrobiales bacterium]